MLSTLTLKNLATISDTSVDFGTGLNILTGETGAGKSILIDGLLLALGVRADRAMVRPGAASASVEALFTSDDGTECIVRREVRSRGRSRFFIDDQMSTLDEGREVISGLVDLHSQDSTPALLDRRTQMEALDEYGGSRQLAAELSGAYQEYCRLLRRAEELRSAMDEVVRKRDIARHEMDLIQRLGPSREDYEGLVAERRELKAVENAAEVLDRINRGISGDDGILDILGQFSSSLRGYSMDVVELLELLEQAEIALSEADAQCERALSRIESAPWRLDEIDQRLDGYSELLGRCGGSLDALLVRRDDLARQLEAYDSLEEELRELERKMPELSSDLLEMGRKLSSMRSESSEKLEGAVQEELKLLGMPHALFRVEMLEPRENRSRVIEGVRLSSDGCEIPEFRFTANPGMDPGPLSSVASGGEMSRISLVLKLALATVTQAPTMIFDEIDSGVGGETANLLADSLSRVSLGRQVIVITHLPQIASRADHHLAVSKSTEGGMPVTTVRTLSSRTQRVEELSRLLGGGKGSREHAEKMVPAGSSGEGSSR